MSTNTVPKSAARKPPGGSRKGRPNKVTKELKDMILGALSDAGGQKYLEQQAKANPAAFLTLIGKVLPLQVTGKDGGAMVFERIVREVVDPKK